MRDSHQLLTVRFFSCPLHERHTFAACVYVEQNPVRARLVRLAWRYPWSSAAAHVGEREPPAWLDVGRWGSLCTSRGCTAASMRCMMRKSDIEYAPRRDCSAGAVPVGGASGSFS